MRNDYKIVLTGALLMTLLTIGTGVGVFLLMQKKQDSQLGNLLVTALQKESNLFSRKITQARNDLEMLSEDPLIIQLLEESRPGLTRTTAIKRKVEEGWGVWARSNSISIVIVDDGNEESMRLGPLRETLGESFPLSNSKDMSLYWRNGFSLEAKSTLVDSVGRIIGAISLIKNLPNLDNSFREIRDFSRSGEFMLCTLGSKDSMNMKCLLSNADGAQFTESMSRHIDGKPMPVDYALRGKSGTVKALDHRGIPVVAAYSPLNQSELGMVLKIDEEEHLGELINDGLGVSQYVIVVILLGGAVLYWIAFPMVRKLANTVNELETSSTKLKTSKMDSDNTALELTRYISSIDKLAMISVTDLGGRINRVNQKFCEGFGYTEDELFGKNHRLLKSNVHGKKFFTDMWEVIMRGEIWHGEICNQKKNGVICWTDATIGPYTDKIGNRVGYFSLKIDITELKNKKIEMQEELVESAALAMIRLNLTGKMPLDQVCQNIVTSLQESMSTSQPIQVLIGLDDQEFKSVNYESMFKRQVYRSPITVNEIERGSVSVWTELIEGSVSQRDQELISRVAIEMGSYIDHQETYQKLEKSTKELQVTNRDLTNAVRGYTSSQKMLEESRELLRKLISHQENVRDEEGRRIAKEVHDDLGSELTGIKSYLSTIMADNRNRGIPPDSRLEEAAKITDNASATVQRIIEGLRPSQLDHLPLWEAIDSNSRKTLKRNNIKFDSEIQRSVKEAEINSELGTALFRIIQETITNVVRHAAAKSVSLQATLKGSGMTILVKDDGRGFTIDRRSHQNSWGIIGMKERVHYFGGDFTITGDPIAGGTTVTIHLPIGATHGT